MAITNKSFNEHLDNILRTTTEIVKEQHPGNYAVTVFIVTRDTVHINALLPFDDMNDVYTALREFGNTVRGTVGSPLAVFVGAQAISDPGTECIVITGCTPDKRTNAGNVIIARDSRNKSCTIEAKPIHYVADGPQVSEERNPAAIVMDALLGRGQGARKGTQGRRKGE